MFAALSVLLDSVKPSQLCLQHRHSIVAASCNGPFRKLSRAMLVTSFGGDYNYIGHYMHISPGAFK